MPSTSAAAGLKTALTGYGQSAAVRIGFAGWRWKSSRPLATVSSSCRSGHAVTASRVRWRRTAGSPAMSSSSAARWKASVDSAPSLSFVGLLAEPVAAAAGGEVVQRPVQAVAAEEPVEGPLRTQPVLRIAADGEGGQLGLDERGRVERLLVARSGSRLVATAAIVSGQPQRPLVEAGLVAEPAEGVEARLGEVVPAESDAADDQGVREPCVVVGERVLEPAPALAAVAA